jgi:twitching motility protein PilT
MDFRKLVESGRRIGASDIHIMAGLPPCFRVNGEIKPAQASALTVEDIGSMIDSVVTPVQRQKLNTDWELCTSMMVDNGGRVRITFYLRAGQPEMAVRLCAEDIGSRESLRLPAVIDEVCRRPSGLVLICGPTGSGKTTTMNYMINVINSERRAKIITIEDPIEYVHRHKRSIVVQQELLSDVKSFPFALRHALRQNPDVLAIGELRDLDTMYTAIQAAETGHLVITTLHTPGAAESILRIVNVFPAGQQEEVRYSLGSSIEAVFAQHLLPCADGKGRVLACEVMLGTPGVKNIIREGQIQKLHTEMQMGRKVGAQSLDHVLLELYREGLITYDCCLTHARDPKTLADRLHEGGAGP